MTGCVVVYMENVVKPTAVSSMNRRLRVFSVRVRSEIFLNISSTLGFVSETLHACCSGLLVVTYTETTSTLSK